MPISLKMKLSVRHKKIISLAAFLLLLGSINYLLFQPRILFFDLIHISREKPIYIANANIRHFLSGHFSDMAWCCSLYLITVVLTELKHLHLFSKWLILLLPFIIETAQYFGIINGTFDGYDLLSYLMILIFFMLFFPSLKLFAYEKK